MTGRERSTRERFGAIFFAFVMVTSMVAIGGAAFAGTAAADAANVDGSTLTATGAEISNVNEALTFGLTTSGSSDTVKRVNLDFTKGDQTNFESNGGDLHPDSLQPSDITIKVDDDGSGFDGDNTFQPDGITETSAGNITVTLPSSATSLNGDSSGEDLEITVDGITHPSNTNTNDAQIFIDQDTSGSVVASANSYDTGQSPDYSVSDNAPTVSSVTTRDEGSISSPLTGSADSSASADDAQIDQLVVDFSEDINDNTLASDDITVSGDVTKVGISTGSTQNDQTLIVQVSGAPTEDTGTTTPSASTAGSGISLADFSSTTAATGSTTGTTDGAEPVYLRAVKTGAQSVDAVFSEQVTQDDGSNIENADIAYLDQNGEGATSLSGTTPSTGPRVTSSANNDITNSDVGSDLLEINNANIEDNNNDNPLAQTTPVTKTIEYSSSIQLSGPSDSEISTDIGGSADARLKAGSAEQSLGLIRIKDVSGNSPLAKRTLLKMPDGVTVDEAASDVFVTTTDGGISSTSASVEDGGSTIRLDHTGSSTSQEVIRLRGVVVNVAPDATASQTGADASITVDYATGELSADLFKIERPSLSTTQTDIVAGQTTSTALGGDIDITTGSQLDNQIGNQTNVVVRANQSNGITFDSSIDPTKINFDSGGALVDQNNVQISQTELTIPVTGNFSSSDSLGIDADGTNPVKVLASGDATSSDLTVDIETFNSTGAITLQSSTDPDFNVQKPGIAIDDGASEDHAVIGLNGQVFADSAAGGAGSAELEQLTIEGSTADIPANTRLTISPNQSDVSFVNTDSANALSVGDDLNVPASESVGSVSITSEGNLLIVNDGSVIDKDFNIQGGIGLDVGTSPADETNLGFNLTTNTGVKSVTDDTQIVLERPNVVLNGGANASFSVDADGETGQVVAASTGTEALSVVADDLDTGTVSVPADSNITVELESGTGVTFDQSKSINKNSGEANNQEVNIEETGGDTDGVAEASYTSPTTIDIKLASDDGLAPTESVDLDELFLNVSGSASDTQISVTTDTGDNEVTTTSSNIISVDSTSADNIRLDPDANAGDSVTGFSFGADQSINAPTVDKSVTGEVQVQNGGNFGGAVVNLEIVETPNGSSGAQLNTTQVTTSADGTAEFNFTAGDTVGDYVVNATVDSTGAGVNVTYTAQPGAVAGVNVTPIENAIAGNDGAETGVAALYVNSTDANGNKVTGSSPTVELTADNVGVSEVDSTDNFDNTKTDVTGGNLASDGTFSLHSSDGSSVVYVKSSQVEDVTITAEVSGNSDTGTVTFFDQVGGVDLTLNESSVATGDTVSADATLTQEDGTVIEVPDVTVSYDDNGDGNTTFETNADSTSAQTNGSGVASVNVTAEQNGTSTIDATSNLRSASATLDIGGQPDTGSPLGGTAGEYDSDGDGQITAGELGDAATAFANEELNASELGDVAIEFANS